jgi:acyl transferase domain-containing protein
MGACALQLVMTPNEKGLASFQLISLGKNSAAAHKVHVTGKVAAAKTKGVFSAEERFSAEAAQLRCSEENSVDDYYRQLRERGWQFGAAFNGVQKLWRRDGEALGLIQLPQELHSELGAYQLHPALLDACLQVFAAAWPSREREENGQEQTATADTYLPLDIESYRICRRPTAQLWSHVIVISASDENNDEVGLGDVAIFDAAGFLGRRA